MTRYADHSGARLLKIRQISGYGQPVPKSDVPLAVDRFVQESINRIGVKCLLCLDQMECLVRNFFEERKFLRRAKDKFCGLTCELAVLQCNFRN